MTPLEMIQEWRRGCSCADPQHPEQCQECTRALIDAMERKLSTVVSPDANVEKNRQMLLERSVVGLKKYGVTTERDDLTLGQWVQHAIEETLDLANYLQALKTNLERPEVEIVRNSAGQIYLQYADGKTLMDYPIGTRFAVLPPKSAQADLFEEGDS